MRVSKLAASAFAICVDSSEYPVALELHKVYRELPDQAAARDGDLRVIDESGEDYLYPCSYFLTVDLQPSNARILRQSYHTKGERVPRRRRRTGRAAKR